MTLGGGGAGDEHAALMDPANRSLAEAMRISFRLVQAAMVILAVLFVFSGIRTVKPDQEGVNVLFGRKIAEGLEPGLKLSWPYPLGELITVSTSPNAVTVRGFFPQLGPTDTPQTKIDQVSYANPVPPRDGALLTSDLNLVHTWWTANYRRTAPGRALELLHPDHEEAIVRSMLERAVVHVVGQTELNEVIGQGISDIQPRVERLAQGALDSLDGDSLSGLTIDSTQATHRTPPLSLKQQFAAVIDARSVGQTARTQAESGRAQTLSAVAGRAAPVLVQQIDRYEAAIETGRAADAAAILETIDGLILGRAVEIDGRVYSALASGEVSEMLSRSEQKRFELASRAEGESRLFSAKLEQFRSAPRLTMARDWAEAMGVFYAKEFVQPMFMPSSGASAELIINEDPDISRAILAAQQRSEASEAQAQRELDRRAAQFQTQRGVNRNPNEEGP